MEISNADLILARKTLHENWAKYPGHHVLVLGDRIFAAKTGEEAKAIYLDLERKYPGSVPLITYIPKKGSLILWS